MPHYLNSSENTFPATVRTPRRQTRRAGHQVVSGAFASGNVRGRELTTGAPSTSGRMIFLDPNVDDPLRDLVQNRDQMNWGRLYWR
jgi:hypothetical protein